MMGFNINLTISRGSNTTITFNLYKNMDRGIIFGVEDILEMKMFVGNTFIDELLSEKNSTNILTSFTKKSGNQLELVINSSEFKESIKKEMKYSLYIKDNENKEYRFNGQLILV